MSYDAFISYSHAADGLLAPRLQSGLQRFAKRMFQRRAIHVFRDESSLSANPHLWSSITHALDESEWFVLLLSPDAASSPWVNDEITYWLEHKSRERIIPVVTDGEYGPDIFPPALLFDDEPRWVDMRFAKTDSHLDLQNPDFSAAIADIASAVRGIPKDELASEEVKQHRRTRRTAWAAGIALAVLAVAATVLGVIADRNATEAQQQRDEAEVSAQLARSRELSASAINVLSTDPELAILLSLEALHASPEGENQLFESVVALRQAVSSHKLIERIPLSGNEAWLGELSPDASLYLWEDLGVVLRMLDLNTGNEVWGSEPGAGTATFSADGAQFAYGVVDSSEVEVDDPGRVVVVDTVSRDIIHQVDYEGCQWARVEGQSPDGALWAVTLPTADECRADIDGDGGRLVLLDSETLDTVSSFAIDVAPVVSWHPDGNRVIVSSGATGLSLFDLTTGEPLVRNSSVGDIWHHELSPDGSLVAAAQVANTSVILFDAESLAQVDLLTGLPHSVEGLRFSHDGQFVIAGSAGDTVMVWDVQSGEPAHVLTPTGVAYSVDLDDETQNLYVLSRDHISVWDLSGTGEGGLTTVDINSWVNGNSIVGTADRGAFMSFAFPDFGGVVRTFDTRSGELEASIDVDMFWAPAILPDGRLVVFTRHSGGEAGPVTVWNPDDGSRTALVGCRATEAGGVPFLESPPKCVDTTETWLPAVGVWIDPAESNLLVSTADGELLQFDPHSLDLVSRGFYGDGSQGVLAIAADSIVLADGPTGIPITAVTLTVVDQRTLEKIVDIPGSMPEFNDDSSMMAVHDAPGQITLYATDGWQPVVSFGAGESRIRGLEFSPDGTMLASGGTDGFLRVWDVDTGEEIHRIPIDSASDAYWIDDAHLVVGTSSGLWTVVTLDVDELIGIAVSRLTRSFTDEECTVYRLNRCPTLEEIKAGE